MEWLNEIIKVAVMSLFTIAGLFLARHIFKKKPIRIREETVVFRLPHYTKALGILCTMGFSVITIIGILEDLDFLLIIFTISMVVIGVILTKDAFFNKIYLTENLMISSKGFLKKDITVPLNDLQEINYNGFTGNFKLSF